MFMNITGSLAYVLTYMTINVTGSELMTHFVLMGVFILLFVAVFKIEMPLAVAFMSPLLLVLMAYSSSWMSFGGAVLIYLSFLFVSMLKI